MCCRCESPAARFTRQRLQEALGSHAFGILLQAGEPSCDQIGDLRERGLRSRKPPTGPKQDASL